MSPRTQLTTSPYSKAVLGDENVFPSVGRIGVGTTDPQAAFHVKNKNNETAILLIKDASDNEQVKVANDGTLSVPDGIFGNGELGVGTQDPTAAVHIISNNGEDKLRIDDSNGDPLVQVNSDGNLGINNPLNEAGASVIEHPLSINGNLRLYNGGVVLFDDGTQLASANFGGSATGVASPSNATINAGVGEGTGTIALNIDEEDKLVVSATTTDVNNNLVVDGTATFSSAVSLSSIDVAGNSALGGTLVVAGASDLNGALDVAGNSDLNGDLDVTGDSELDGALVVTGDSDLEGNLTVQKTAYLDTLYVSEGGQIGTTLYVGGASDLNGALAVAGKVNFSSSQDVNSTAGTGTLSIGPSTGAHMSIDGDEIQSRDQSGSSMLHLQREGGRLRIFNNLNTNSKLEVVGEAEFSDKVYINNSDDVNETAGTGGLNVGNISSYHIGIDPNEINAKNGANAGSLSLQSTFGSLNLLPENDTGDLRVFGRAFKTYADHHGFGYAYESVFFNIRNVPGKSKIFNVQGENEVSIWYISADGSVHDTQGSSTVLPDRMVANDPPENSLNNIMNLNIVKYNNRGYKYGLVLDQVDDIYPELVKTTMPDKDSLGVVSGDSYKSVNMTGISAITIQAIKELKIEKDAEVKAIKKDYDAKLAAMLARINNLENQ